MSTTVAVALATAVLVVVALVVAVFALLREVRRLTGSVGAMNDRLRPELRRLSADAEVTRRELERLSRRSGAADR